MKEYKIVEMHDGENGNFIVETYTDSFAQAVSVLGRYNDPFGNDIKSSTLLAKNGDGYIVVGTMKYETTISTNTLL